MHLLCIYLLVEYHQFVQKSNQQFTVHADNWAACRVDCNMAWFLQLNITHSPIDTRCILYVGLAWTWRDCWK